MNLDAPGEAQPLPLPRPDARGRAARALLAVRAARPGRPADGRAAERGRRGDLPPGLGPEPDLTARALAALREAGVGGRTRAVSGSRSRSRFRSPPGSAAAAPMPPPCSGWRPASCPRAGSRRSPAALGADVTSQLDPRFCLVGGAGETWSPSRPPLPFPVVLLPIPRGCRRADVYAEADRLGLGQRAPTSCANCGSSCSPRRPRAASRSTTGSCSSTTSPPAAISLRPAIAERSRRSRRRAPSWRS